MLKKITVFLLMFTICFMNSGQSYAYSNSQISNSDVFIASQSIAEHFLTSLQMQRSIFGYDNVEIYNGIPLYDANEIENGAVFNFTTSEGTGYITVLNLHGILTVIEFSKDGSFNYDSNERLYCFGILSYFNKIENGKFYDIKTGNIIEFQADTETIDLNASLVPVRTKSYWHADGDYSLFGTLPFISQQPNKEACAATSAAMILQYWKNQKNFTALPVKDEKLRDAIIDYMGVNVTMNPIYNGINNYVSSINPRYSISGKKYSCIGSEAGTGIGMLKDSHLDLLATQIGDYDQPAIVIAGPNSYNISTDSTHALAVKGVFVNSSGDSYLSCNDPWADTKSTVNIIWHPENDGDYFYIFGIITFSINGF